MPRRRWAATPAATRAAALEQAADQLETGMPRLIGLLMREAGKTAANAVAEVREAVDFLRYYALQARAEFDNAAHAAAGPGGLHQPLELSAGDLRRPGVGGAGSGQHGAGQAGRADGAGGRRSGAGAAGRRRARRGALQFLPGPGETVGAALIADARTMGVMFTGSTEVARILQRSIAGRVDARGRAITLIAETGGQNAMIVDSSALVEQVVDRCRGLGV